RLLPRLPQGKSRPLLSLPQLLDQALHDGRDTGDGSRHMGIDILIPALGRPNDIPRLMESLPTEYRVIFICSPLDMDQIDACRRTKREVWIAEWEPGRGDFAKKINWAYERTDAEWVFQGATDLRFHPGWDKVALRVAERSGKRAIGTNDSHNPQVKRGMQSTHTLIARSYIEE